VELLGLAQQLPSLSSEESALIIMPGTHSKHVKVSNGMMLDFDTLMTGELFACLQTMPTLRDSVLATAAFDETHPWFLRGLREAASPGFFKALFKIRSRNLLRGVPPADGAACLSGLLIGTELLQVHTDTGSRVLAAASVGLNMLYRKAATELGLRRVEFVEETVMEKTTVFGHLRILENSDA
jgi:2-dehydro-3-deoxygalactonokinase